MKLLKERKRKAVMAIAGTTFMLTTFFGANYGMKTVAAKEVEQIRQEVVTKAQEDVVTYITDYATEYGIISDEPVEIDLTQEQMESITSSVSEVMTTELISEIVTSKNVLSEESLETIESVVSEEVVEVIKNNQLNVTLSDGEKSVITSTVSTIVKKDLLNVLNEHEAGNEKALLAIKTSLEADIADIQKTLEDYGKQIASLKDDIDDIDDDSASGVQSLLDKYNLVVKDYTKVTNDITLLQEHLSKDATSNIEDVKAMINRNSELIATNVDSITLSLNTLNDKIIAVNNSVTGVEDDFNEQIESVNNALLSYTDKANEETKQDLIEQIKNVQTSLQSSINKSEGSQRDALQTIYKELSNAQELLATEEDVTVLKEQFTSSTEKINENVDLISDRIASNTELIKSLGVTLDDTNLAVDNLVTALNTQKNTTDQLLLTLESNMTDKVNELAENTNKDFLDFTGDINQTVSELSASTDEKISELQTQTTDAINSTNQAVSELSTSTDEKIDELSTITDEKISELSTSTDEKISELRTQTTDSINSINQTVNNLSTTVTNKFTSLDTSIDDLQTATVNLNTTVDNLSAATISYDNTSSGLEANTLQEVVDELKAKTDENGAGLTELETKLLNLLSDAVFIQSFDEENGVLYLGDYDYIFGTN